MLQGDGELFPEKTPQKKCGLNCGDGDRPWAVNDGNKRCSTTVKRLCYGKKVFFDPRSVTEGRLGRAPAWGEGGETSVEGGSYYCRYDAMDKKD